MASPSLFLLVCVAGISFVLVEAQTCSTVGETFCKSCSNLVLCDANLNELNIPCPTGQVCGNGTTSGDSSGCYILTSTPTNNFALCACTTTPGYLADPFDPSKYQVCIATGIQVEASCPPGEVFDGSGCAVGPTMAPTTAPPTLDCTDKTPGFQTLPPACTSYYACLQDPSNPSQLTPYGPYTCPNAGDVFTGSVCVAESDLLTGIEPYMCTGTETGAFLDTVECNAFHICMGKL
ncbi:hypothetical protein SK128_003673 [Halocaridina rubra]|uniref:Sodefrin-like factor n=1 Tax=Halocaridina rubra TaxID=373956 RepID=A0AAN9ACS6_HALRR